MLQHTAGARRIAHLSDIHLPASGLDPSREGFPAAQLAHTLEHLQHDDRCDAIVVTGDITNFAGPLEYLEVRDSIEGIANTWGSPTVWAIGNNDNREVFSNTLLVNSTRLEGAPDAAATVTWVDGLRIIALDVARTGEPNGHISYAQLYALEAELAKPSREGTILAMHRPVRDADADTHPTPLRSRFENAEALVEVVQSSDVIGILTGYEHRPAASVVGGVLQWTGAGLSKTPEDHAHVGRVQFYRAPGYSIIEVANRSMRASHAAIFDSEPIAEYDVSALMGGLGVHEWPSPHNNRYRPRRLV